MSLHVMMMRNNVGETGASWAAVLVATSVICALYRVWPRNEVAKPIIDACPMNVMLLTS